MTEKKQSKTRPTYHSSIEFCFFLLKECLLISSGHSTLMSLPLGLLLTLTLADVITSSHTQRLMTKRGDSIQDMREDSLWTNKLADNILMEIKRETGQWMRLKKDSQRMINQLRKLIKDNGDWVGVKGKEREVISFTDWARLKKGPGKRSGPERRAGLSGWVRMMRSKL